MLKLELPCVLRCALDMSGEELLAHWEVPAEAAQLPETSGLSHAGPCGPSATMEESRAAGSAEGNDSDWVLMATLPLQACCQS